MKNKYALPSTFILFTITVLSVSAQVKKAVTLDDIWKNRTFSSERVDDVNWFKSGSLYSAMDGDDVAVYDITTGLKTKTLIDAKTLKVNETETLDIQNYTLSPAEDQVLIETGVEHIYRHSSRAYFYLLNLSNQKLTAIKPGNKISLATFSPDGKKLAYTYQNNLYTYDIASGKETEITKTGKKNELIHGSSDWVYEEEFAFWKAFDWSPDSKKLAFMSFDERNVPTYNMQIWSGLYPKDYTFKYPKAGEKNSKVDVSIYDLESQKTTELEEGSQNDQYIARMQWTKNPNLLSIRRMNRIQNQLEVIHIDATTGKLNTVLTETSKTYIDINDDLKYLENGKEFVFSSDRSGFQHLYRYGMDGKLLGPITSGNWEVTSFLGLNEKSGLAYYMSTEDGSIQQQLYSIKLSGKDKNKLSVGAGTHRVTFNPSFTYFIDDYSSAARPSQIGLYEASGKLVKMLKTNETLAKKLDNFQISPKVFSEITTAEGIKLNSWTIKPLDFNPSKKYPVLMFCYGGPGHQTVTDSWDSRDYFWYQMLASKGYIIVSVDNRGTGGKGADFKKATYAELGKLECEDQIATAKYLATLPYVDASRIGIWGWSFGGYLTSLCMVKGADIFKTGIAVAPVTNWRFYDSIYTERFLKLPQDNASGYDQNSPVTFADKLKGNYLLVHGTGDDNVHFQNAVAMVDALVRANKKFESFYYPNKAHGMGGEATRLHLFNMLTDFITEKL